MHDYEDAYVPVPVPVHVIYSRRLSGVDICEKEIQENGNKTHTTMMGWNGIECVNYFAAVRHRSRETNKQNNTNTHCLSFMSLIAPQMALFFFWFFHSILFLLQSNFKRSTSSRILSK